MILLAFGLRAGVHSVTPRVESVPVVSPGGEVRLLGAGFGAGGEPSAVLYRRGDRTERLEVASWSDDRILARGRAVVATGEVRVERPSLVGVRTSEWVPVVVRAPGLPSEPFGYEVPVEPGSPWPLFRRDRRNTGRSPLPAHYGGDRPWAFATGKGIFSTPVIDADGTIYVGSADHVFYAVGLDGRERWRFRTGEIIDSAAAVLPPDEIADVPTVVVPSADGHLYRLRTGAVSDPRDRIVWSFDARDAPRESFNDWFEANVTVGFDGTLYAGNTNFNYYAVTPDGELRWVHPTGANAWSIGALADDGTIFWASNDSYVRAVRPDGVERWTRRTLGMIAASAAVGPDGTVYIGSFDSNFYALEPRTGAVLWKVKTDDHVYASAALSEDPEGRTLALYVASTDGRLRALDPEGRIRWTYDTGDVIRSSPVLGAGPEGEPDAIVYFGAGNGKLYALDAAEGTRRWSFDTTPEEAELRDRNDLNASPALGQRGIYIAGEHGRLWYVPYDYCLAVEDPRCETDPKEDVPSTDLATLLYVTPGGNTLERDPEILPPATLVTLKLVVRSGGRTVPARLCNTPFLCSEESLRVSASPPFPFHVEKSGDGRYLHVRPDGFLPPGQSVRLTVEGDYHTGGLHVGNLTIGGRKAGRVQRELRFRVSSREPSPIPSSVGPDAVPAFEWTRVAVPIPTMLPSLNQIGFDYMDWIVGVVHREAEGPEGIGRIVLWGIGARRVGGALVADPETPFTLPLSGETLGNAFVVRAHDFVLKVTGIPIPFRLHELRGALGHGLAVRPGATLYAETDIRSIPTFGPYLVLAGLGSNVWEKLVVTGTYVTRPYPSDGPAHRRPRGVEVADVEYRPPVAGGEGEVLARVRIAPGARYPLSEHRPGLLLLDRARGEAVPLDYARNLAFRADSDGNLEMIRLAVPPDTPLPERLEAVVLLDVFPAHRQALDSADARPPAG